jgi:transcriptional regulator with XRE-family HTH domain
VKNIGKRIRFLREYSGLSRTEFGGLFNSKESTVYEWESGRSIPRLAKLINISAYFSVSLDCLLNGRMACEGVLEERLSQTAETETFEIARSHGAGQLVAKFNSLSSRRKERLIGYLDALYRGK